MRQCEHEREGTMPRNTYSPEPGTREHDRARSRSQAKASKEVRKIDRALRRLADQDLEQTRLEAILRDQRANVYALLA